VKTPDCIVDTDTEDTKRWLRWFGLYVKQMDNCMVPLPPAILVAIHTLLAIAMQASYMASRFHI